MDFSKIRIQEVHVVVHYKPTTSHWVAKDRRTHIIGIKLKGKANHDFGFMQHLLEPNCVFFFNQKDNYAVTDCSPDSEALSVHFTTTEEIDTDSFCIQLSSAKEFETLLKKAQIAKNSGSELALYALVYRFLAELDQVRQKRYFKKDARILSAKEFMDTHYTESDCLENAVLKSGITARHFTSLFRESFDTTPNRYITFKRMEYAKSLLLTGTLSVQKIAEHCGYTDIYYFSKVFKKEVGVSPTRWK